LPHATCQHQNQAAESFIEKVWIATKRAQDNIREAQAYQFRYANRHQKHITFQKGDLVRLSTAHALQDSIAARPNAALQPRFMGPYRVVRAIGPTAYELALPGSLKCHPVIHISQLQPYHDPIKGFPHCHIIPPPPVTIDGEQEFEVEKILDHRF